MIESFKFYKSALVKRLPMMLENCVRDATQRVICNISLTKKVLIDEKECVLFYLPQQLLYSNIFTTFKLAFTDDFLLLWECIDVFPVYHYVLRVCETITMFISVIHEIMFLMSYQTIHCSIPNTKSPTPLVLIELRVWTGLVVTQDKLL